MYIVLIVTMTKDGIAANVTMILRYANIFCAACHGELKAVEHQTIRIGKAKSFPSRCSLNLISEVAPMNICCHLATWTCDKTSYNLSITFLENSAG